MSSLGKLYSDWFLGFVFSVAKIKILAFVAISSKHIFLRFAAGFDGRIQAISLSLVPFLCQRLQ
jgi:hypothetical protein